jgi:outer membrane protein insertion porin family
LPLPSLLSLCLALWMGLASPAAGQGLEAANRPIAEIRIQGLSQVPEQLVRNQIRSELGGPYDPQVVEQDIVRITHLGRFSGVRAEVTPLADGSVVLTFLMSEQPLLADVGVVGNKSITDQDLLGRVLLQAGDPADPFLIDRGKRQIIAAYEEKGFFVADVTIDEQMLSEMGILIYQIREGPKVRLRDVDFEGNVNFTDSQLKSRLRSKTYIWILRGGEVNREQLELDAAAVREFYQQRGYLDAQVGRRIDLAPNQKDATVVFLVEEGQQYIVDNVRIEGNEIFPPAQIELNMTLRRGDVYSLDKLRASQNALRDLYGKLGYLDTEIQINRLFHERDPKVDLVVRISEGQPSTVGTITVRGNELTKSKVILRQLRGMDPGRRYDRTGVETTRTRLNESSLFSEGTVTILDGPQDTRIRDALVEVKETNTGSIMFGAGISSDAGVVGAIDLTQKNFDITDFPEDLSELLTGRAFRGAGQYFGLSLQPGNETSRYAIDFREPYAFETDYFFDSSAFFFSREREDWDEARLGAAFGVGQRFGDVWSGSVRVRANSVDITDIDDAAPVDVFAVEGASLVTGLGLVATRNTTDSRLFPTRGSYLELGLERVGALGGDFDFTRAKAEFRKFWTVDEDFFGRRTVVSWRGEIGYIFEDNEAPVFERFYAGGHRDFRGFAYRGVGPRGIRADNGLEGDSPVGGDWLLLTGAEYNFPIWQDILRGVFFTDMGTVQKDPGFDEWRVSIGTGVRIKIPFLGQAPFALDLAVPILKQDGDETQIVSFDLSVPIQ